MVLACIDIGSNTTRLLVARAGAGALSELCTERAFTRIGAVARDGSPIPSHKIDEVAAVVGPLASRARELGARRIAAVATAAVRSAPNAAELTAAVLRATGVELRVLSGEEEARLSFAGAVHGLGATAPGGVAVVDVGGGSTEIAAGTVRGGVEWLRSIAVGSGTLSDRFLRSDPPAPEELEAVRDQVDRALARLDPPDCALALAVGGTATSLARVVGPELSIGALECCVTTLAAMPVAEAAEHFGLDPRRVALLPAGMLVLAGAARVLGRSLTIAGGGLREGVLLDLVER